MCLFHEDNMAELHLFIKEPQAPPSMKCCVRIRCRNIDRTTKIFDRTTTNRDQAKPTTLIPSCPIKIQLKNYPQGNISSTKSSLKTNLWRKFPIQICKGQGATKKLLKPRCGSIELNIRAGFLTHFQGNSNLYEGTKYGIMRSGEDSSNYVKSQM